MYSSDDAKYKKKMDPAFSGVVKLASLLQKALDTGRSNYVEMSEVSRYLSYSIKTQIDESVRYVDYIQNNHRDDSHFRHFRKSLLTLFNELNNAATNGYEKLVSANGDVSKMMLEELILLDTEVTNSMKLMRNALIAAKSSGEVTDNDLQEIEVIAKELNRSISARTKLFA